ncbi:MULTISPECIES: Imm59 family immunity protein [Sporolactobacillus]|uniref:Uncharacterized protein n=1 Tax=Sporolactobacillus putidus TaxID=492735 RepID=A0A917S2H9_9BACL|nr:MULTISPECIES: Imm59 family immunity protein [Sporolactobacillus]MDD9149859.1 Imm59 family immunity protein [Sporolactobacillus sp. CQH2019]GGL52062.1 hypothetical protein GCM10007968_15240 [Sporolactobacillus putidus]
MNVEETKMIIQKEGLKNYCFFCDRSPNEREVVIQKSGKKWAVYTCDERAAKIGEQIYNNESDALEDFVKRLRGDKLVREYYGDSL